MILVFYQKPSGCGSFCLQTCVEIICLFILRFCTCFYYCVLFLFVNELFPASTRGIGFGVASAFGAASTTSCNIILTTLQQNGLSPHLVNIPLAIIAVIALRMTP
jgi:uncharacterized membrane-anchored protein YitT (DUF2179 family)